MIDPVSFALGPLETRIEAFNENSRYRGLPVLVNVDENGVERTYVGRRFLPEPESLAEIGQYEVQEHDRIDTISFDVLGDAELWWRVADANRAIVPAELTERVNRRLRITLPEGMPGPRTT